MEALAWHMHGLPLVRYRNLVYLEEDPQNESGIDCPPSMTDSGGFPPGTPVSTHQSRVMKKIITRDFSIQKREYEYKREYKKRTKIEK